MTLILTKTVRGRGTRSCCAAIYRFGPTGEALYRFLLSQAETPPTFLIHCRGTHNETRPRRVERTDSRGRRYTDTEFDTETVTDFDFTIEHQVPPRATQWTVGDEEPAYRGRMSKEVGRPGEATKADHATIESFKAWLAERRSRGLPPWVAKERLANFPIGAVEQPHRVDVLQSSWTLRQWADDYCQSRKIFKEFVYRKVGVTFGTGWSSHELMNCNRSSTAGTLVLSRRPFAKPSSLHTTAVTTSTSNSSPEIVQWSCAQICAFREPSQIRGSNSCLLLH